MVNSFVSRTFDAVLPNHCVLCGLRSFRALPLCIGCEGDLPANGHACRGCALPLPQTPQALATLRLKPAMPLCGQCQIQLPLSSAVVAPWLYDEHLAYLIQRWKFHSDQWLSRLLANLWLSAAEPPTPVDLLVPVPLHWRRRWQRGFNQAELLCRQILRARPELGRLDSGLVRRVRASPPQSGATARERRGNLLGAFTVRRACDNLRIAIVDDVYTTGATANALVSTLQAAGANDVQVWCLARTPAPGP